MTKKKKEEYTDAAGAVTASEAESAEGRQLAADTDGDKTAAAPRIPDELAVEIFDLYDRVMRAKQNEDGAHEEYKQCRKSREELQRDMGRLIGEAKSGVGPLFGSPTEAEGEEDNGDDDLPGDTDPFGEDWGDVGLATLADPAVAEKYLKALAENDPPITTLGELTDWQTQKGDFWIKDLKGLGPAAEANIAAASEKFWARRNGQ